MADTNIIDAENLISGSTVSAPENISYSDTRTSTIDNISAQLAQAKTQALAIQDSLATKVAEEAAAKEKLNETNDLATAKEGQKSFLEKILAGDTESRADVRATEEKDEGISEKETLVSGQAVKVASIQGEIDKLEVAKQAEIASARDRVTAYGNIEGAIDEIERKYDTQKASLAAVLSGEAALMNAYQGNLTAAQNNVTNAINDYMYGYDQEVERYKFVYDYYGDWVDSLEADQKVELDRAYNEAKQAKANARVDQQQVGALMLEYPASGIMIGDTIEDATKKASSAEMALYGVDSTVDQQVSDWTANQVLNRQLDFNTLDVSTKKDVLQNLALRGEEIPRTLTATEKATQSKAISALGAVSDMMSTIQDNSSVLQQQFVPFMAKEYKTSKNEAKDVLTRIRTGAALNEQELKFYESQMPGAFDSTEYNEEGLLVGGSAKYKLDQLAAFFLGMSGVNVTIENPETGEQYTYNDMYSPEQRLEVRKAINNNWLLKY